MGFFLSSQKIILIKRLLTKLKHTNFEQLG